MSQSSILVLGSSSPARLELLKSINITPEVIYHPNINEEVLKKEKALEFSKRITLAKLNATLNQHSGNYIIVADTVIVKGSRIIGKPKSKQDAYNIISTLSGCNHRIITSLAVASPSGKYILKTYTNKMSVRALTKTELKSYIESDQWQGRAGGYSINGLFQRYITKINGSHSSIIGLPLNATYNLLTTLGYKV